MALCALGLAAMLRVPSPMLLPATSRSLFTAPLVGVLVGLGFVAFCRYGESRWEWLRFLHREFHAIFYQFSTSEIFLLAFFSALGEELLFRGVLQAKLGLVLSNVLFALLHVRRNRKLLPWTAMSFVVGMSFGTLYVVFGDLGAPLFAHFIINLLNLRHTRHALRV
jgi:hypothetical protein